LTGMSGLIYLATALILGLGFIYYAIKMMRHTDNKTAMKTFFYSINYLMIMFAALLVDHYFPISLGS
ncbi:MAG: protoheme IX farnesyltransferase, partial [Methylomarinum sp.]|nr:protoheme IX farnesyltransferase [Methylomarinum sp.]